MQLSEAMPRSALAKMVRSVSTRNYEGVIETVREGFGIPRSSVSRRFVKAMAKQVEELRARRWQSLSMTSRSAARTRAAPSSVRRPL
jgi:hypothetical protein